MNSEYSEAPNRRRRKSFAALYKSIIIDDIIINSSSSEPSTEEGIIKNHISLWNTEMEDWKKKAREIKFEHLSKMRQIDPVLTWKDCKDCLTADDIAIVKAKTSCEELAKEVILVDQKREIVDCLLHKTDVKMNATVMKKCTLVQQMKKNVCKYLLDCDESNDPLFEDVRAT